MKATFDDRLNSRAVHPQRIHHVGIVVPDLDVAIAEYLSRFGGMVKVREVLADQGVEAAAIEAGSSEVELIAPVSEAGGVARFLERRGPGLHHIAYAVGDLDATLRELEANGAELIDRVARIGLGGHRVAFVHPRSFGGVLTEFVEEHD